MKHLEQHQQKQYRTSIVLIIVSIFAILYFMFTYGIKLLLTSSAFIASLTNKKTEVQKANPDEQYGSISIDNIPTATNSAKIIVSGSTSNFNKLTFYINGDNVKEINLISDNFSEEIGDLKTGNNEIFTKVKQDKGSLIKQTPIYNVLYKNEKPKLEIKEPKEGLTTSKSDINIKGITDKETFIKINDMPIVVDVQGNFQTTVFLKDGENKYIITAEDVAGNIETKELKIIYQKD
jgi:hypothetical protein